MLRKEVILYLGKPELFDPASLKESFTVHNAKSAKEVYQVLERRKSKVLTIIMDLDSVCQVGRGWQGTSSTSLGRSMITKIREIEPLIKLFGLTRLMPLAGLLEGAGCDIVCTDVTLVEALQDYSKKRGVPRP